ncbi:DUF4954 family protein [Prevotella sp. LMAG:51]|uniref:DUF4954 family protein n=1 Tax=Prevotella sp. LMAG:51 TaxID=1969564 RepID=UPI00257C3526|nr:DUF4954 family protein [Prevotella sp. LMAG:51]
MRTLTPSEIKRLEENRCHAEDWQKITVGENFSADRLYDVQFIGECSIGSNSDTVTTDMGYELPTGIRHARIINSTIGDNTLVENVSAFICNADIGDNCIVNNVSVIQTTEGTTFGQGNTISVMNEAGEGNVVLYSGLTSQIAALTVLPPCLGEQYDDADATIEARRQAKDAVRRMVMEEVMSRMPKRTLIEDNVHITDTIEITNSWITQWTEVRGAQRISETTLWSRRDNSVFVGAGAIIDGCIVTLGSSVSNNAIAKNCFIGENSTLTDGFSATDSLFFANSYMANGEACAAFCGPFSVSHHKSTLLIGGMYSFYNAGSGTNFSNHAYKMGPIHYGIMERGAKTASGAHILWPAHIGAFTMCMGKIATHPDTSSLPFSYIIGDGTDTYIVPARNIATVGTYRDTAKWPRRDMRPQGSRRSMVDTEWLNPSTMTKVVEAKVTLEALRDQKGAREVYQTADGSLIKRSALEKGISLYTLAIKLYLNRHLKSADEEADYNTSFDDTPASQTFGRPLSRGASLFADLGGMQISNASVMRIVDAITSGNIDTTEDLMAEICRYYDGGSLDTDIDRKLALRIADAIYGWNSMDADDRRRLIGSCHEARREWYDMVRRDAEREYELGDVDDATLNGFLAKLEEEEPA